MGIMKDYDRRIRQGGDDAIAALSEYAAAIEPRWIPVEERWPEEGIEVLVSVDENSDDCGYHVCLYRGGEYVRSESGYIFGVTHWMPLPEPP